MASSRVMASSSPPQHAGAGSSSDLARFKSSGVGSMNMDDIIRNIYGPEAVNAAAAESAGLGPAEPSLAAPEAAARRTSEEVWKEISAAGGLPAPVLHIPPAASSGAGARGGGGAAEMTLEDFLARDSCGRAAVMEGNMALGFPDGDGDAAGSVAGGVGGVRGGGKRALLDPADRAVMQRQKRMIKNRESAARSRDRKQAYVAELESQVMQLEEEQTELLREQEDRRQKRLKELTERAVPVIRKKSPQDLRRTNSMEW
ncbi:bZIP transcription factor 12 [Zea mays]|uniref:G-box-binding factor 4 n=1 Tax=Zea mays TaxID=4577 RepID=B6TGZ0_MAIZE|eukprot:NP_001149687.1 G-box-binding factor 4 [Zea mays]